MKKRKLRGVWQVGVNHKVSKAPKQGHTTSHKRSGTLPPAESPDREIQILRTAQVHTGTVQRTELGDNGSVSFTLPWRSELR
jgi:hypothetical protein